MTRFRIWFVAVSLLMMVPRPSVLAASDAPTIKVAVDIREVPEAADWSRKAKELVEQWHPRIVELLPSDGFKPAREVRLVFKKDYQGVAYARGTTIVIAAAWIKKHPDDFGMVVHELTHVIQAYPKPGPSWLVEGIADYVRFCHYEPATKLTIADPRRASYRDSYRTSAKFLDWVAKNHDQAIVRKLNAALRKSAYHDELFRTYTGKTLDELWEEFVRSLAKKST